MRSKPASSLLSSLDPVSSLKYSKLANGDRLTMHGKYVNSFKPLDLAISEHRHLFCSLLVLLRESFAVYSTSTLLVGSLYKEKLEINFEVCCHFQNHMYT